MSKIKFGKYAILTPVVHHFINEPEWTWTINPANVAGEMEVARLLSTQRTRTDGDGMVTALVTTTIELAMREIAVTFGGTNIKGDLGLILPDDASYAQVEEVLCLMPREMILEIWSAVGDACPGWGPVKRRYKGQSPTSETEDTKN